MAPLHARTSYSCNWHQDALACPSLPFLLERSAVTASTLILMNRALSGRNSQAVREERSRSDDITARWCSWWQHQRELSWRGKMGTNDFSRLSKSPDLQACLAPVREEHAHSRSSQILSCPHHGLWWLGFPVSHPQHEWVHLAAVIPCTALWNDGALYHDRDLAAKLTSPFLSLTPSHLTFVWKYGHGLSIPNVINTYTK